MTACEVSTSLTTLQHESLVDRLQADEFGTSQSAAPTDHRASLRHVKQTVVRFEPDSFPQRMLPEKAERKGLQNERSKQLESARIKEREAAVKEGIEMGKLLSATELQRLETLLDEAKQKVMSKDKELKRLRDANHQLHEAKRQRTLSSWLARPANDRPAMQLPARQSHFDVEADKAKGYSDTELQRTFRAHVERVEHFIEDISPDPLKQLQLADAVNRRFGGIRSSLPKDNEAAQYVLESLKNFESTLRERYEGRYPNHIRAAHQAVSAAITSKVPPRKLSVVAEATGISIESLSVGRKRWNQWFDGTEEQLMDMRGRVRADKMNEEWLEFAAHVWEKETRPAPSTKCSIRNPHKRSDKKLYRIHYLDMRIGDMHKLIVEQGREKFADADPPFHFSWWYCMKVRPFFVKPAGRETSVCIYHLRFDLMVEALYVFYKRLRDAKRCSCHFENIKYPADFRRTLVCPREEGARYDANECVTTSCTLCGELQRLNICGCIDLDSTDLLIRWEEYQKIDYRRKDGSIAQKKDFVVVNTPFQGFLEHFSGFWQTFAMHHQTAKLQEDDIRHLRENPVRGEVITVEDFSESDHIQPKREHASRYFSEVSYTLFGMVLTGHLDDFENIGETEREDLRDRFEKKRLPLAVTESHIVISGDLNHDAAAVIHFNDKVLTPYIKSNMKDIRKRTRITDGAPQHFKLADMALWTSRQQVETGIRSENVFGATAHRKDLSDSECGGAKHVVHRVQMGCGEGETSKVKEPYDAYLTIKREYAALTHERFLKNGCVGIYRRFIYWVPAFGDGSIDRNIQHCQTLSTKELGGIKSLHQLIDIGQPGKIIGRQCSCHSCDACKEGRFSSCVNIELLGPAETITLQPNGGRSVRLTRNALAELGVTLAEEVQFKEIIGIELTGANESFMLGEVLNENGPRVVDSSFESYMGKFVPGDKILDVRKLEPTSAGSSMYEYSDKRFPIFVEDVRKRNMQQHLEKMNLDRRSRRLAEGATSSDAASQREIYQLSAKGKSDLLKLIASDSQINDRRDLREIVR